MRSSTGCGAENRQLRVEREILSKAAAWFPSEGEHDYTEGFRFVSENQAVYPIATMSPAAGYLLQRLLHVELRNDGAMGESW